MKISEHKPLFVCLCIIAFTLCILILTDIDYAYKFSIGVVIAIIAAIFTKLIQQNNNETIENNKERGVIAVPRLPKPYHAHFYGMKENFTGREEERKKLTDWFKTDSNPMFVYVAIGGMGKSALAWYWHKEDILNRKNSLKGVMWWSFSDKEADFESFLNYAITYVSDGKADAKKIESTRDKMNHLYDLLSENQFLLVLDGVERLLKAYAGMGSPYQGDDVKEDEKEDYNACVELNSGIFLQMLAKNSKTKTLITTRICPKELNNLEGVITEELTKIDKDDAVTFFQRQGVKGMRAEIEDACSAYGYHPLSLRLLSGTIVHDMKYNGDIKAWTESEPKLPQRVHDILEQAYNSLDNEKQEFISKISAFRNPMDFNAIAIFNVFKGKFNDVLNELVDRGMLFRDRRNNSYDLHPIVRTYCYGMLRNKKKVHHKLMNYFDNIPVPETIESLDDLAPVIELYFHTVRAERYDKAWKLYKDKLADLLYYKFGVYKIEISLLRELFPEGVDKQSRLKKRGNQAWTWNQIANSYSCAGQPKQALPLYEMNIKLLKKAHDKEKSILIYPSFRSILYKVSGYIPLFSSFFQNSKNFAISLTNFAYTVQIPIGNLEAAESNLTSLIEFSSMIKSDHREATARRELGLLLVYLGKFNTSKKELKTAIKLFKKLQDIQRQCIVWSFCSLRAIYMSNADEALKYAKKSRKLADVKKYERDIIQSEYLLGAAYLMKGCFNKTKNHLTNALDLDRKISLLDMEPCILLEFAKLRFNENRKEEALNFANEALQIADRCEYRLKQADIHTFLAEFYLNAHDLKKAKDHGTIAKEMAQCGYKPALAKANKLLDDIAYFSRRG